MGKVCSLSSFPHFLIQEDLFGCEQASASRFYLEVINPGRPRLPFFVAFLVSRIPILRMQTCGRKWPEKLARVAPIQVSWTISVE